MERAHQIGVILIATIKAQELRLREAIFCRPNAAKPRTPG